MMDQKELFRKVGEIVNEINEQYKYLAENPDKMKDIEMELFAANANFLADHIRIIQKLNNAGPGLEITHAGAEILNKIIEPAAARPAAPEQEVKQREPATPAVEPEKGPEPVPEESEPAPEEDTTVPEGPASPLEEESKLNEITFQLDEAAVESEEDNRQEVENEAVNDVAEEEIVVNEVVLSERTISVDTPAPTVNELISSQRSDNSLAGKFNREPVADLKSIINLNDKLLFIKDLFKGYSLAYSEAIELLNRFDSFDAADNFLKTNYAIKNNWSEKQATADKFYEVLNRRFTR